MAVYLYKLIYRKYFLYPITLLFLVLFTSTASSVSKPELVELPRGKFAALFSDVAPETGTPAKFFKKTSCKGWDYDNRSIVVDIGKICLVNEVRLEADGQNNVPPHVDDATLYVSLDNKEYTKVKARFELSPCNKGSAVWIARFSGFKVFARYIKAHNGYGGTSTGFFSKTDHADMLKVFTLDPHCTPPEIIDLKFPSWLEKPSAPAILNISNTAGIPVCLKTKIIHSKTNTTKQYTHQIDSDTSKLKFDIRDLPPGNIKILAKLALVKTKLAVDQKILNCRLFSKIHNNLDSDIKKIPDDQAVWLRDMRKLFAYPSAIRAQKYTTRWGQKGYLVRSIHPFTKEMVLQWPYQGRFAVTVGVTPKTNYVNATFGDFCKERLRFVSKRSEGKGSELVEVYLGTFKNDNPGSMRISMELAPKGSLGYIKVEPYKTPCWLKPDGLGTKRVIVDNDGFSAFYLGLMKNPEEMAAFTRFYKNTDIQGVIWCVGNPIEVNYKSRYVPLRFKDCLKFPRPREKQIFEIIRDYIKQGEDTLDTAIRVAHENSLFCWASLRMNFRPNPIYTKKYIPPLYKHMQDYLLYKTPEQKDKCLSYAFVEFRRHVIKVFSELMERNPDGILVELTRYPPFVGFNPNIETKYRKLKKLSPQDPVDTKDPLWLKLKSEPMTDLMRQLRNAARAHEKQTGQKITIAVHVSNSGMYEDGIDLKTWAEKGLLDVIIVGNGGLGGISSKFFRNLSGKYDIKLYGHIHAWFGGHDPTPEEEKAKAQGKNIKKEGGHTGKNIYKKLALDYYRDGFDGIYMWDAWMMFDLITTLGDRENLYQWYYYQQPAENCIECITVH